MVKKLKKKHLKTVRKQTWLYDAIASILVSGGEMNAWNVTLKLREITTEPVNDKTVRLYLHDMVERKEIKLVEVGNHSYYRIIRK